MEHISSPSLTLKCSQIFPASRANKHNAAEVGSHTKGVSLALSKTGASVLPGGKKTRKPK